MSSKLLNPLSIQLGQTVSGKQINDWCKYQIENCGSHVRYAKFLLTKNYRDDRTYMKIYKVETAGYTRSHTIVFCKA